MREMMGWRAALFNRPQMISLRGMRRLAALTCLIAAAPASAQHITVVQTPIVYDPAAEYVTAGQDEPGYRRWVMADPSRMIGVKAFNDYLVGNGVGGVVPTWQLLRTASMWGRCSDQPFEVPPAEHWPNIVAALRYVGAFVEPVIGPVEPVSAYRNPRLNVCAGGAPTSTHMTGGAIDMVPLRPISRVALMEALCRLQIDKGSWNHIGFGFYKGVRFHIDARKTREWGTEGNAGGWGCIAVLSEGAKPFVQPVAGTP
jgi:hypothetical protein